MTDFIAEKIDFDKYLTFSKEKVDTVEQGIKDLSELMKKAKRTERINEVAKIKDLKKKFDDNDKTLL